MHDAIAYAREWRAKNPEKVVAAARKWQLKNPEKTRANNNRWRKTWTPEQRTRYAKVQLNGSFKRKYGISLADYEALLQKQNGHCGICDRTPEQEHYKRLNVDHDHKTNKARGLLCTPCNQAIGRLGDTKEALLRALTYLEQYE